MSKKDSWKQAIHKNFLEPDKTDIKKYKAEPQRSSSFTITNNKPRRKPGQNKPDPYNPNDFKVDLYKQLAVPDEGRKFNTENVHFLDGKLWEVDELAKLDPDEFKLYIHMIRKSWLSGYQTCIMSLKDALKILNKTNYGWASDKLSSLEEKKLTKKIFDPLNPKRGTVYKIKLPRHWIAENVR